MFLHVHFFLAGQAATAPTPAPSTPDSDMFRIRLSGEEQHTYLVMGNSVCECGQGIDALMHTLAAFQTKLTTMYEVNNTDAITRRRNTNVGKKGC